MQYRYAKAPNGDAIDIKDLTPETRNHFGALTCFGCNRPMAAALGNKRERHFKHKADGHENCSHESYLHRLAKRQFVHVIREALRSQTPFKLVLPKPRECRRWEKCLELVCLLEPETREYDLTEHIDQVAEEVEVDGFVADVLLSSSKTGKKLLIEMKVSNGCSHEKIASGLKIIEIDITSEEDLRAFSSGIDVREDCITLYNIKDLSPKEGKCDPDCGSKVRAFHVFQSGKIFLQYDRPSKVKQTMERDSTVYTRIIDSAKYDYWYGEHANNILRVEATKAIRQGVKVKACTLCRYSGPDCMGGGEFCKFRRVSVVNSEAARCSYYRPEH